MARIMARTPIIALPYSERHKAVPKELLVDYETGNIYVVSADDKSIIFDITSKIFEQLENMSGDNIEITIEGLGTVKLTEIIKKLQLDIANTVQVIETGEDMHYVGQENVLDNKSLTATNRSIHLKGFTSADTHMIPRKGSDGQLEWINMPMVPECDGNGGGSIIPPSDPDDGNITGVHLIEPVNDKLYLRPSRRQKSINIDRNCIVVLPRVLDEFSEIEWYVSTNSFAPMLKFTSNVVWANIADTQPRINSNQVYKFKSWNAGENWLAEIVHYNKAANDAIVDIKYLEEYYYNKEQTHETFYDKVEMDEIINNIDVGDINLGNYYNKDEVDSKLDEIPKFNANDYYDKDDINNNYYDKNNIDAQIDSIEKPNLEPYATIEYVADSYYNKTEVDYKIASIIPCDPDLSGFVTHKELKDEHYTKEQTDGLLEEIIIPDQDLSNYVERTELVSDYYNKTEVDAKLVDIPTEQPDLSDYYNKAEIDNKFDTIIIPDVNLKEYVKTTYLEQYYYDKLQINKIIDGISSSEANLLQVYKNTVILENKTNTVNIGISEYDKNTDAILVFKNNIYLEENIAYTISENGESIIKIEGVWKDTVDETMFNFLILKNASSKDGTLNVYTKQEVNNNFYTKDHIDNEHLDKRGTEQLISWNLANNFQSKLGRNNKK